MRSAGIYLLEVELGQLTLNSLPAGDVMFTLRIGSSLLTQAETILCCPFHVTRTPSWECCS